MKTKSGKDVFPIGIGTWNICSKINSANLDSKYRGVEPDKGDEQTAIEAVQYSISKGQNHIDCAELYGGFYTDEVIGRALENRVRKDLYIADKLWKHSVAKGQVRNTVNAMLRKLKTDYLDLLYIHAPWEDIPWEEALAQIDELIDEGIVRHLGVSNFTVQDMKKAQTLAKHPIAVNQMNYNVLYKDEVDQDFVDFCKQNNVTIVAYQPIKRQEVLSNQIIKDIAAAHDATPAQVALAWLLERKMIPIPKALQRSHIDENVVAVELRLSESDMEKLNNL